MAPSGSTQAYTTLEQLLDSAWRWRWRAPELALVFGKHAEALATVADDGFGLIRARACALTAGFRLGQGTELLPDALAMLRQATDDLAGSLRLEAAEHVRALGLPRYGFALLRPLLSAYDLSSASRAITVVHLVSCLVPFGWRAQLCDAMAYADHLYAEDRELEVETVYALRGQLRALAAVEHRRQGELGQAVDAALDGLSLLAVPSGQVSSAADTERARVRLTLELVLALLDRGDRYAAQKAAEPVLHAPPRATSAEAVGWLRLVLATRVHQPSGDFPRAEHLLRETAAIARHHQFDKLLVEASGALAELAELVDRSAEALEHSRVAQAARNAAARHREQARALLADEVPAFTDQPAAMVEQLERFIAAPAWGDAPSPGYVNGSTYPQSPLPVAPVMLPEQPPSSFSPHAYPATEPFDLRTEKPVNGSLAAYRNGVEPAQPELWSARDDESPVGFGAHADPAPSGRHGARAMPAVRTGPSWRTAMRTREARHAASHDGDVPIYPEPDAVPTTPQPDEIPAPPKPQEVPRIPDPNAVPKAPEPDEVPRMPEPNGIARPPENHVLAGSAGMGDEWPRADLGLADLLAEALAAFRTTEEAPEDVRPPARLPEHDRADSIPQQHSEPNATGGRHGRPATGMGSRSSGAHADGSRPDRQWRLSDRGFSSG